MFYCFCCCLFVFFCVLFIFVLFCISFLLANFAGLAFSPSLSRLTPEPLPAWATCAHDGGCRAARLPEPREVLMFVLISLQVGKPDPTYFMFIIFSLVHGHDIFPQRVPRRFGPSSRAAHSPHIPQPGVPVPAGCFSFFLLSLQTTSGSRGAQIYFLFVCFTVWATALVSPDRFSDKNPQRKVVKTLSDLFVAATMEK